MVTIDGINYPDGTYKDETTGDVILPDETKCVDVKVTLSETEQATLEGNITANVTNEVRTDLLNQLDTSQPMKFLTSTEIGALTSNVGLVVEKLENGKSGNIFVYQNGSYIDSGVLYSQTTIQDGSVTPPKTNFFNKVYSSNRLNMEDAQDGYGINPATGEVYRAGNLATFTMIDVEPNKTYTLQGKHRDGVTGWEKLVFAQTCGYDKNGNFKPSLFGENLNQITIPNDVYKIRFSMNSAQYIYHRERLGVFEGTTAINDDTWEEFKISYYVKNENLDITKTIQNTKITLEQCLFADYINLYDDARSGENKLGYFFANSYQEAPNYNATYPIEVEPNTKYYVSGVEAVRFVAFLNEKNNPLGYIEPDVQDTNSFTTPRDAKYVVLSLFVSGYNPSIITLAKFVTDTPIKHTAIINNNVLDIDNRVKKLINNETIKLDQCDFSEFLNLYDKDRQNENKIGYTYVNEYEVSNGYNATYPIEAKENETYYIYGSSFFRFLSFLDKDKKTISYIQPDWQKNNIFTTPPRTKYIVITIPKSSYNPDILTVSKFKTNEYIPYKLVIKNDVLDLQHLVTTNLYSYLPEKIYVGVGQTIEIYNSQVCPAAKNYHIQWITGVGSAYERKLSITGTTRNVGEYDAQFNVFDDENRLIRTNKTKIIIGNDTKNTNYNVIAIGDSITNNKPWVSKLHELAPNIAMCGTRGVYPNANEGRSGWTAKRYLQASDPTPNEGTFKYVNPFFNPTKGTFDFTYYMQNNPSIIPSGQALNAVIIFLGTNDYHNGQDTSRKTFIESMQIMINSIKDYNTNLPIFLIQAPCWANQNGIGSLLSSDGFAGGSGAYKFDKDLSMLKGAKESMEAFNKMGLTKIYYVPVVSCLDSEYNFGKVEKNVNPWNSEYKEYFPLEAVHPAITGYNQIADVVKATIVGTQYGTK